MIKIISKRNIFILIIIVLIFAWLRYSVELNMKPIYNYDLSQSDKEVLLKEYKIEQYSEDLHIINTYRTYRDSFCIKTMCTGGVKTIVKAFTGEDYDSYAIHQIYTKNDRTVDGISFVSASGITKVMNVYEIDNNMYIEFIKDSLDNPEAVKIMTEGKRGKYKE